MTLFRLFEQRTAPSLENPSRPLTDASLVELFGGVQQDSGITVTEVSAMSMSAVWRAVSLISGLAAALPLHAYVAGSREQASSMLLADPHPTMTPYEFWRVSYLHRLLWGNFVAQKIYYPGSGRVQYLHVIPPERVHFGKASPIRENPTGLVYEVTQDDGSRVVLTPNEVFHLPGLAFDGVCGMSPIRAAAQGIGLAQAAERSGAKLFGSGNMLSGLLKTTQRLNKDQAEALQARWRAKHSGAHRAHEVAVLDSGAEFQSLTMPNDDAQWLESRRFQLSEIGRFFGVPAFLMGDTEKSTSWGTGLEQQASGFVTFDLHPLWLAPTESRVSRDLLGEGFYAKYAVEGLLRGDSEARAAFYTAMRNLGVYSSNDIRALEDQTPIPADQGGDDYIVPMNMVRLRDLGALAEAQIKQANAPAGDETNPPAGDETDEGGSDAPQPAE